MTVDGLDLWHHQPKGEIAYYVADVVSYGLIGWAWLMQLNEVPTTAAVRKRTRRSYLIFAVASTVLALGYLGELRDLLAAPYQSLSDSSHYPRQRWLRPDGCGLRHRCVRLLESGPSDARQ